MSRGVYTATLVEDLARREAVADMMRAGDWRGVIKTFHCEEGEDTRDPLLVWIRPSLACLKFISSCVRGLGLSSVSSVGCGNGTLGEINPLSSLSSSPC